MNHLPPNRRHYGIDRAQRALDTEIELAVRERDGRLRSIRAMARAADVSLVTMWKAVQVRRERGDIRVRSRGAITAARHLRTDPTPPATAQARPRAWEAAAASITADLARRVYPEGGVLPPVKLLASRYGVCRQTMQRALDTLERRKLLGRAGKRLRVAAAAHVTHPSTIALVALGDSDQSIAILSERTQMTLQYLETDCARLGLSIIPIVYSYEDHELHSGGIRCGLAPVEQQGVLGTIFWPTGMSTDIVADILSRLVRGGKPVAMFDEGSEEPYPHVAHPSDLLRAFTVAGSSMPGEIVGRYLLRLGHRRVAFISSVHANRWSQRRLEGLRCAFAAAGFHDCVEEYTADLRSAADAAPEGDRLGAELKRVLESIPALAGEHRPDLRRAVSSMSTVLARKAVLELLRGVLEPLVDSALAGPNRPSAWVTAADTDALFCLDILSQRGVRVPQDVSIVGFDNLVESFTRRLTSYDFNIPAYLAAMLGHIVHRTWSAAGRYPQATEFEGFVTPRATVCCA